MIYRILIFLFCFSVYSKPISITNKRDLDFGTLVQGDPKKVISPKGSEPNNARFLVKGDKNTSYTILLPTEAYIYLGGNGSQKIKVRNFKSRPAAGANGLLNSKGKQTVKVGATLNAIGVNKAPGAYSGSFTIDVIY
ncbi:hypothetical protein BIY24_11040 [Halobacteriovorax marinus]|uniref:DUF4402 domain-containing protein n=1 Tax=Halobacteriovorax marinus TaxID=97084 RepID=UPI000BC2D04D|nr:DUF4402 domain-containing protein [Halobacteriovorax marinus]ATH08464.1 hypothetical protein BIY24_11040 [Halobacteriovorax marinus]